MATIEQISKLAGCSSATVSRTINNSATVSLKTREAVMKAIAQTQYLVQRTGRRGRPPTLLKGRGTRLVEVLFSRNHPMERMSVNKGGLTIDAPQMWDSSKAFTSQYRISASFYLKIVDAAVHELSDRGYRTVMQSTNDLGSADTLAEVNRPDRDGVLLIGEYCPALGDFVKNCVHPLVLVDLIIPSKADVVTTDNQVGISKAFEHLYSLGHRKIGFAGKLDSVQGFVERYVTFKWKMAEFGLPVNPLWVYEGLNGIVETEQGVRKILAQRNRPTALVCVNDCAALGAIRAASGLDVRIPEQLSVVGFDDEEASSLVTPALTTVRTPVVEIGIQSARQIILQIEHPQLVRTNGCCVRLTPDLVVRESTARCA